MSLLLFNAPRQLLIYGIHFFIEYFAKKNDATWPIVEAEYWKTFLWHFIYYGLYVNFER